MKKVQLSVIFIVFFIYNAAFGLQVQNHAQELNDANKTFDLSPVKINSQLRLIAKSLHENNPQFVYEITAQIPQIVGNNLNNPGITHFNSLIIEAANKHIQDFKKEIATNAEAIESIDPSMRKNYLKITYDVNFVKPKDKTLVSVRLNVERMQAGRAHPYHSYAVFNFDLDSGRLLGLNDLFKSRSDYLKLLAAFSKSSLKNKLQADSWMVSSGTTAKPENFQYWNLTNDALLLTFKEYQVAPYTGEPQEVKIPLRQLKTVLNNQYLV